MTTNQLRDLLNHHDGLETKVQVVRRQMLPLTVDAYSDVATALHLVFGSEIDAQCAWLFGGKAWQLGARPVDVCLRGDAKQIRKVLMQALHGICV